MGAVKYVGLDLGRWQDPSALAVVDQLDWVPHFDPSRMQNAQTSKTHGLVLRYLERMALEMPYTEVVRRVAKVLEHPLLAGHKRLVVDATGVGMPVVEMLASARLPCTVMPVVMTGGYGEHSDGRIWHVPKMDLLGGLHGMLEREELKIARGMREAGSLVQELTKVEVRVRASGRVRVGADGSGEHDDLVIAVALACWAARKGGSGSKGERLFW